MLKSDECLYTVNSVELKPVDQNSPSGVEAVIMKLPATSAVYLYLPSPSLVITLSPTLTVKVSLLLVSTSNTKVFSIVIYKTII